jgi:hypothetical protein
LATSTSVRYRRFDGVGFLIIVGCHHVLKDHVLWRRGKDGVKGSAFSGWSSQSIPVRGGWQGVPQGRHAICNPTVSGLLKGRLFTAIVRLVTRQSKKVLKRLGTIEPRSSAGHLPIDVRVEPLPGGTERFDFTWREFGAWTLSGEARMIESRLTIDKLTVEFTAIDFGPEVAALTGEEAVRLPPGGITSDVLRGIPVGQIAASIRQEVLARPEFDDLAPVFRRRGPGRTGPSTIGHQSVSPETKRMNRRAAKQLRGKVLGRGRRRKGPEHYRAVGEAALRAQDKGKGPIRSVLAEQFGVDVNTIRDWLSQARRQGWLAPTSQGQRGVMPGPRLLEELKREKR